MRVTQSGESTQWTSLAAVRVAFTDVNVGIGEKREAAVMKVREMMKTTRKNVEEKRERGAGNMMRWVCFTMECLTPVCLILTYRMTRYLASCDDSGGWWGERRRSLSPACYRASLIDRAGTTQPMSGGEDENMRRDDLSPRIEYSGAREKDRDITTCLHCGTGQRRIAFDNDPDLLLE